MSTLKWIVKLSLQGDCSSARRDFFLFLSSFLAVFRSICVDLIDLFGNWLCSSRAEVWGWALYYAGTASVAFGSSYYHLKPDDDRIIWDTLPVSVSSDYRDSVLLSLC